MIAQHGKPEHPGAISLEGHTGLSDDYFEVARLWVSSEQFRSFVLVGYLDRWSPELIGSLLVESLQTVAIAYAAQGNMSKDEVLERIWRGFDDERANIGSEPRETH